MNSTTDRTPKSIQRYAVLQQHDARKENGMNPRQSAGHLSHELRQIDKGAQIYDRDGCDLRGGIAAN